MFEGPDNPEVEQDWNKLYTAEHVPLVLENRSEVIRVYRYVAIEREGEAPKYLTIYELKTPIRSITLEVEQQIRNHRSMKMQPHSRDTGHGVYRQIYPED